MRARSVTTPFVRYGPAVAGFALVAAGLALVLTAGVPASRETPKDPTVPLPGESLYQLRTRWTTDDNRSVRLESLRGHVQVMAMIFTRCPTACPTLVREIRSLAESLPRELASATRYVLVSIDPERDTPEVLAGYRDRMGLDAATWTLLRGRPEDVRELSAVLGFNFGEAQGSDIMHSKLITVLDREGRIAHQQPGLGGDPARILAGIARAVGSPAP